MEEGEEEGGVVMEGWECYIEDTVVVEVAHELLVCTILYFNFLSSTPPPPHPPAMPLWLFLWEDYTCT